MVIKKNKISRHAQLMYMRSAKTKKGIGKTNAYLKTYQKIKITKKQPPTMRTRSTVTNLSSDPPPLKKPHLL